MKEIDKETYALGRQKLHAHIMDRDITYKNDFRIVDCKLNTVLFSSVIWQQERQI